MKMRTIVVVSSALGLAGLLWMLTRDASEQVAESPVHPRASASARASHAQGELQSRMLRAEVAELRREVRAVAEASAEEPAAEEEAPQLTTEELVTRVKQRADAVSADLRAHVESESIDTVWAKATESAVLDTLGTEQFQGFQPGRVFCASTMCEVSMRSELEGEELEQALAALTSEGPFRSGGFVNYGAGDGSIVMYIARHGHELPSPPAI